MLKVVIIEDEELLRKGLIFTFDWAALSCVVVGEASNGQEGIHIIETLKPDLVITDIKMPVMDGLQMLAYFKEPSFESILMTGFEEFDFAKRAIELNVAKYLTKPIDENELRSTLQQVKAKIQQRKHYQQLEPSSAIELIQDQKRNQYDKYTQKILNYIELKYHQTLHLSDLATQLDLSVGYMSKVFKASTSYTINDYLNRHRIMKAIELLRRGEYRLFEIAERCGFSEYKYFHHVFKLYLKMSPREFINSDYYQSESRRSESEAN
jgi:two-component system response regulator YesN